MVSWRAIKNYSDSMGYSQILSIRITVIKATTLVLYRNTSTSFIYSCTTSWCDLYRNPFELLNYKSIRQSSLSISLAPNHFARQLYYHVISENCSPEVTGFLISTRRKSESSFTRVEKLNRFWQHVPLFRALKNRIQIEQLDN